jgi:hypothetical protein
MSVRRAGASPRWVSASPRLAGLEVRALAFSGDGSRVFAATPGRFFTSDQAAR